MPRTLEPRCPALQRLRVELAVSVGSLLRCRRIRLQALRRVLAQQLVHLVSPTSRLVQQRPVHKPYQVAQRCAGHLRRPRLGEPAAKDRERPQDLPFVVRQQVPGMIEHGPHAPLPLGEVAPLGIEEIEAL